MVDPRGLGEELVGATHQRFGDLAREVRVAAGVVVERVEDPERRLTDLQRVPGAGRRLVLHQRQRPVRNSATSCSMPGFAVICTHSDLSAIGLPSRCVLVRPQPDWALAAAFFCALKSRTFCSESASTTSATER